MAKRSRSTKAGGRPPTPHQQHIAKQVRSWREERGWSVAELARRADLPIITIERIEAADRPATLHCELEDIAHACEKKVGDLYDEPARSVVNSWGL